jgi:hypothetical protein
LEHQHAATAEITHDSGTPLWRDQLYVKRTPAPEKTFCGADPTSLNITTVDA